MTPYAHIDTLRRQYAAANRAMGILPNITPGVWRGYHASRIITRRNKLRGQLKRAEKSQAALVCMLMSLRSKPHMTVRGPLADALHYWSADVHYTGSGFYSYHDDGQFYRDADGPVATFCRVYIEEGQP